MKLFRVGSQAPALLCSAAALLTLWLTLPAAAAAPGVGSHAPPLALADLDDAPRKVDWGEGAAAATIIYFFDPQSSDCLLEMSFLDALYARARDLGLAVFAVDAGGRQRAEVSRSLERYCAVYRDPAFPILADPAFRAVRTYGAERVPVTFIMEGHGVILNRIEGYSHNVAVAIARRVEQLLGRERGVLSPVLRESGISEDEEREAGLRLAAAIAAPAAAPARRALGVGDRVPEIRYTDLAGRSAGWTWSGGATEGLRIVAFIGGLTLDSVKELNWLDGLSRRGREIGLDVLVVEAGGMSVPELQAALEKYRRYNPEPSFPLVPDTGGRIAGAFGPWERLPQTYLIAGNGTVVYHADGFSVGESEIMTGKVERAFLLAGRPFPQERPGEAVVQPATAEEEAPSVRKRQNLEDDFRSAIVKGDAAFMAWEFERALSHYQAALEMQPQDLHALVRAAQICERRGEPLPALEYWRRVLAVRPDHAEAAGRVRELLKPR